MKIKGLLLGSLLLALTFQTCREETKPCGSFLFQKDPEQPKGFVRVQLEFQFNPSLCNITCQCNTIAWVQIGRIRNHNTGEFLQANSEQEARMVKGQPELLDGWAVDRGAGRVWGYFGRRDDGAFIDIALGSNSVPAVFADKPGSTQRTLLFDFVSVPVCIDEGASCANHALGYYYWWFLNGDFGMSGPFDGVGPDWTPDAFNLAVAEWNNKARGLGKKEFPTFTRH